MARKNLSVAQTTNSYLWELMERIEKLSNIRQTAMNGNPIRTPLDASDVAPSRGKDDTAGSHRTKTSQETDADDGYYSPSGDANTNPSSSKATSKTASKTASKVSASTGVSSVKDEKRANRRRAARGRDNDDEEDGYYDTNGEIEAPGAVHVTGMKTGTTTTAAAKAAPPAAAQMENATSHFGGADEEAAIVAAEVAPDREKEVEEAYNQGAKDREDALQEAEQLRKQVEELKHRRGDDVEVAVAVPDEDQEVGDNNTRKRRLVWLAIALLVIAVAGLVIGFLLQGNDSNTTVDPNLQATSPPSSSSDLLPPLTESFDFPLGLCQGDCDSDVECQEGLRCFQRTGGVQVPGCSGGLEDQSPSDYCIIVTETIPSIQETDVFPLGICQGDCDSNVHCDSGLICFQRNGGDEVPGCSGGADDESNTDYCISQGQFVEMFGERLVGSPDDNLGSSVSLSSNGKVMAVAAENLGSTAYVNIYESVDESSWSLASTIETGVGAANRFGDMTVELSGDGRTVAIGFVVGYSEWGDTYVTPQVRILEASSGDLSLWNAVGDDIVGSEYDAWGFGYTFSLSGDGKILAFGQPGQFGFNNAIAVYRNEAGQWVGNLLPLADDSELAEFEEMGWAMVLSKTSDTLRLAVNGLPGHVRVFELTNDDIWLPIGQTLWGHDLGTVALSGDGTVVAFTDSERDPTGCNFDDDGTCVPDITFFVHIYAFDLDKNWTELGVPLIVEAGTTFKSPDISLSNDGQVVAIGEPFFEDVGRVRLLQYYHASDEWTLLHDDIRGRKFDERFGAALSLGGSAESITMAVGAPFDSVAFGARGFVTSYRTRIGEEPSIPNEPTLSPTDTPEAFEIIDVWIGTDERMIGNSVSLSRDGLVLAYGALNSALDGIVHVYKLGDTGWDRIGELLGNEVGTDFGHAVSLSGDGRVLAVGSPKSKNGTIPNSGRVRVFEYEESNGMWFQIGLDIVSEEKPHLVCNGTEWPEYSNWDDDEVICDEDLFWTTIQPQFGHSLSLSEDGSILAIGAPSGYDSEGNTDVYRLENGQWKKMGNSIIGEPYSYGSVGWAVSISSDGMRLAVGANTNEQNWDESGAGRIYELIDGTWQLLGQELLGEDRHDLFGSSISLSGDGNVVAIGSVNNDNAGGDNAGHVRIYSYNQETNWTLIGKPIIGKANGDRCGSAVSLNRDGTKIAVGANLGAYVRVYEYDAGNTYWREIGAAIEGDAKGNGFGARVALADVAGKMTLAVGAPLATAILDLGQTVGVAGEVYVFEERD